MKVMPVLIDWIREVPRLQEALKVLPRMLQHHFAPELFDLTMEASDLRGELGLPNAFKISIRVRLRVRVKDGASRSALSFCIAALSSST